MKPQMYTFSVPVTIRAIKRVDVVASSEKEALEMLTDSDWYDTKDDVFEEECEFSFATLDEVSELDEVAA
jgi:hypothetical protein